jgi:hypothetical protein
MKALKLSVLVLSLVGATALIAGPGPQYWAAKSAPKAPAPAATATVASATPAPAACSCCGSSGTCSMHR